MQNPERLVLDFAGARLAVQKTVIPGISAPVRGVRIGQYRPDVARVVVDLTTVTPYRVARDGDAVVIYFENPSTTPVEPASSGATLTSEQNEKPRQEFDYRTAPPRMVAGRSSKDSKIPAPRFALPSELTQPSVTLASFNEKKEPVRPDSTTQQAAQQAVQQANTAATAMAASSQAQAPAVTATPAGKYTGEPISVNLKDVDLKDFFRLIHEISGLNVVLDPAVKGSLTIVLDEVPWDQALDIVLQNNSLDKQLNGNVLRIATRATLKSEAETQRDLVKAQAEAVDPVTVYRVLSYAKAATMATTLKKFLSSRGDVLADERSNQLVRSEEHTSELQSQSNLVCRLLLEKKKRMRFNNESAPTLAVLGISQAPFHRWRKLARMSMKDSDESSPVQIRTAMEFRIVHVREVA